MKKVFYVIIGIAILYLILAMVGPSGVKIERKIAINKPAQLFAGKLSDLKFFYEKWSPWTEKDPNMKVSFTGDAGTVGHKMEWSGNDKVKSGTMKFAGVKGDSVLIDLSFGKGRDAKSYYITENKNDSAIVTWGLEMKVPFFGRPMMIFMNMDKMMGPDFEKGLANLKKTVEEMKTEAATNYEVKEIEWPATHFVGSKRETVKLEKLPEFYGKHFSAIMGELGKNKIQPEGPPMGMYWAFDEANGNFEVAAVFKVAKEVKVKDYITYSPPASKVLQLTYYGDYQKMMGAYEALDAYMEQKNAEKVFSIEEYVTDPMSEKDTVKWQTNIYYLLK